MSDGGLDEIRRIFEEEAIEGLDTMESGLLNLEAGEGDQEVINDIFRAAHSIKGGSATFGYTEIAGFTHVMETLMDLVRDGKKEVTQPLVTLLLNCVDCMREMMDGIHTGEYDEPRIAELTAALNAELSNDSTPAAAAAEAAPVSSPPAPPAPAPVAEATVSDERQGWHVSFHPHRNLMQSGNQPTLILRALGELGEMKVVADVSELPKFEEMDPELLYIGWEIELYSEATEAQVREVFEWVEDECDLDVTPLASTVAAQEPAAETAAAETVTPGLAVAPQPEERREAGSNERRDPQTQDRRSGDRRKKGPAKEASSIRVGIDKVDNLLNLVGELVITQAMLSQYGREGADHDLAAMRDTLEQLSRNTRELQDAVMQIRMLPVSVTFSRFPRLVHDLSQKLGKDVELKISGEQTELDKTVLEKIGDPLVHLIRNSLDHGIEDAATRLAAGKDAHGTIHISASHESGNIVIRVQDDGAGLNADRILAKAIERGLVDPGAQLSTPEIHALIFQAGFSTADIVSDVSGRGVGMDVVRSNIQEIGGRVEVFSTPGEGSTFAITLPLTLAILDGQLVRVGKQVYVVPLLSIVETVQVQKDRLNVITGKSTLYRLRGEAIPVIDLSRVLRVKSDPEPSEEALKEKLLVIVEAGRRVVGLAVDELLEQHQVVIKSLETNYTQVDGALGATILGDGTVSLIVDIPGLVRLSGMRDELNMHRAAEA